MTMEPHGTTLARASGGADNGTAAATDGDASAAGTDGDSVCCLRCDPAPPSDDEVSGDEDSDEDRYEGSDGDMGGDGEDSACCFLCDPDPSSDDEVSVGGGSDEGSHWDGREDEDESGGEVADSGETLDVDWWDTRFRNDIDEGTVSEWLMSYEGFSHFMTPHLDPARRTLVVGCGNSDFSAKLCSRDGFRDVVNTDVSAIVVDHMRDKHAGNAALTWVVDDATRMAFGDRAFDQIVDKSLLDCMCHCDAPADARGAARFVGECHRVLRPGGVAVFATDRTQAQLERKFECAGPFARRWGGLDWTVERQTIYAPVGADGISTSAVAVSDAAFLPDCDCCSVGTMFIFVARKGGEAKRTDEAGEGGARGESKRAKLHS